MAYNAGGNFGGNFSGIPIVNPAAPGGVYTMGTNLPSVDPNNYSGNIHFGPASTVTGQFPAGAQFGAGAQFPAGAQFGAGAQFPAGGQFPAGMQFPNATYHPGT